MSGHIFFADNHGFDDALYCGVRLLNIVSHGPETLAQLRDALPAVINTPELRFQVDEVRKFAIVEEIKTRLKDEVDAALALGVFGGPYVVIDGEPFFGADRLPQIEKWLESGGF